MTNETPDNDVAAATSRKVPPTANTGAIATMGLDLQEGKIIPRKQVFSWALWDWATQPFNTVLLTFVWVPSFLTSHFFLTEDVAAQGRNTDGTYINCDTSAVGNAYCDGLGNLAANLGWGITLAGILIALLAPVMGQRADAAGRQKLQLGIFTGLLVLCQLGLAFVDAGPQWFLLGVTFIALGSVVGEIAGVSYNALLVSVSTKKTVGKVSGLGWGFGYLGGIVALAIVVGAILGGLLDGNSADTFRIVALGATVWTVIFAIPILVNVPEPMSLGVVKKVNFFASYIELIKSIARLWRETRPTFWFLLASAVYRDGLAAVFTFGSVIAGAVFGFGFTDLVIFGIVLNLVAGVSTILSGRLDDRVGPKPVIMFSIAGLIVCTLTVFFAADLGKPLFWVVGIILAMFVGPAQASSRSFLARVTPAGREGEVFGLYATTGRAASWLASLLWGVFIALAANQILYGILGITAVLAVGFVLLAFVRSPERVNA
ncbi:MAG: MFS transporter [Microbacteriaceae bacterium]|nr:MFS transporter [Microbacteriaceae bacterium]